MASRAGTACLIGLVLAAVSSAHAARVYKWTDSRGVVHYGDRAPASAAAATSPAARPQRMAVTVDPTPIAALRVEKSGRGFRAIADNRLAGPVETRLEFARATNVAADPSLPVRTVVPARGSIVMAFLETLDTQRGGDFELRMDVVPGDPAARARDVEYVLPLRLPRWRIDQGFGGSFSHADMQNRFAIDLAAPIGTPVLAARDGIVMEVEGDFARAGLNRERYGGRANQIRLLHDDGSMSVYAHLDVDGVLVRVGQRVRSGQQIALSGNTGFTTGPHLHFAVQVNRGMRLESIPFRMRGPQGPMRLKGS